MVVLPLSVLVTCVVAVSASFSWTVPSKYSHFTKRISPNIYSGGKVTERQIESLAAAGFKSILSTLPQSEPLDSFNGMEGPFPSSAQEFAIASQLGMAAVTLETEFSPESAQRVSDAILALEKPIYIHCGVGYGASLFAQLHLFRAGIVPAEEIFPNSLTMGWDYQADQNAVTLVNAVTSMSPPATVLEPSIELTLSAGEDSYKSYYWSHRVGSDSWYNIGQILDSHVKTIAEAGYKTVISFRNDGEPTCRLESDPDQGTIDNGEFSDADGNYNVTAEKEAFESVGVDFINLPVSGDDAWSSKLLDEYSPAMNEAMARGPVLAHCTSGYRSSAYVTAFLARQQNQCVVWALEQARRVGYSFDIEEGDANVVDFYLQSLKC